MTRLVDLCMLLATNFLTKEAKIFGYVRDYFEKHHFLIKTVVDNFKAAFWKNWANFITSFGHTVCEYPAM